MFVDSVTLALNQIERFFNDSYKQGIDMYSFIHGEIIVQLMAEGLRPLWIKRVPIDIGGQVLVFLSSEGIDKMLDLSNIGSIDDVLPEIEEYLKTHTVDDSGNIIKKENKQ